MRRREFIALCTGAAAAPATASTAITGVTVIDGTGRVLRDRTVVVEGSQIAEIRHAGRVRGIDARGQYLIPGLWDMHVHLSWTKASALPCLLANGVTSVRDMGGLLNEIDSWRQKIADGVLCGPTIHRAGPTVNGRVFNFHQIAVTNEAEARGAVRALQNAGVDFIKVHAAIGRDAYFGVAAECKTLKLPFAGHIPRAITAEEASDAGQASLEHADNIFDGKLAARTPPGEMATAIAAFRNREAHELFARFVKNGTYYTPTLAIYKGAFEIGQHSADPRERYVSRTSRRLFADLAERPAYQELRKPETIQREKNDFRELLPLVGLMNKAGVPLLAGTDLASPLAYPGFSLHDELALLVEAGLSPIQAIQAATRNPARLLKVDHLGTIEPGNTADMVLLNANPLEDIRNTRRITAVFQGGGMLDRGALDSFLAEAERMAKEE